MKEIHFFSDDDSSPIGMEQYFIRKNLCSKNEVKGNTKRYIDERWGLDYFKQDRKISADEALKQATVSEAYIRYYPRIPEWINAGEEDTSLGCWGACKKSKGAVLCWCLEFKDDPFNLKEKTRMV